MFKLYARCYSDTSLEKVYGTNEKLKKRAYNGGMGRKCCRFYSKLAGLLATKKKNEYSLTVGYVRTRVNFNMLRMMILCIRGSPSHRMFRLAYCVLRNLLYNGIPLK